MSVAVGAIQYFDLNIEKVLEHWPVSFAVREIIANALDEQAITGTAEPAITQLGEHTWVISDHGRGLRYQHLTQKENSEKKRHPAVIGQFGMGLKDALAVFHRRGIGIQIHSPHGDITTVMRTKEGFADITTLHAAVHRPTDPARPGTRIVLDGIRADQITSARQMFLRYNNELILETSSNGQVLARPDHSTAANIYVKGLLVAQEENFLFSYNITNLTKNLRQALNRERTNVGRTAYTDRVKAILKQCRSADVARGLADDLGQFSTGHMHDELTWTDVAVHACKVLAAHEKVVFVSRFQLEYGGAQLDYARHDGYRLVLVPDDIATRIGNITDLHGEPLIDLDGYRDVWNGSFTFQFVPPAHLRPAERRIYDLTDRIVAASGINLIHSRVRAILISETMRLDHAGTQVLGVYEPAEQRIVIRRDQLADPIAYCGTLLHELTHAASNATDGTLAFESALTQQLGILAVELLGRT